MIMTKKEKERLFNYIRDIQVESRAIERMKILTNEKEKHVGDCLSKIISMIQVKE